MKRLSTLFKIKEFPFRLYDKNNKIIYLEYSDKFWVRCEYDSNSNQTYYENSNEYWVRREFDSNGNETYFEDSFGIVHDTKK